jgi:hypothetical protein
MSQPNRSTSKPEGSIILLPNVFGGNPSDCSIIFYAGLKEILGEVHPESYICVQEVSFHSHCLISVR